MSQSTHQAISGMQSGEAHTHERCVEAVRRYGEVRTEEGLQALYAWAKEQSWFLRSEDDEKAMRAADLAARRRIVGVKEEEAASRFPTLSRRAHAKALEVVEFMTNRHGEIAQDIQTMVDGNYSAEIAPLHEIARWIDPERRFNRASFFMQALAKGACDADGSITRAAFQSLAAEQKTALTAVIEHAIEHIFDRPRQLADIERTD